MKWKTLKKLPNAFHTNEENTWDEGQGRIIWDGKGELDDTIGSSPVWSWIWFEKNGEQCYISWGQKKKGNVQREGNTYLYHI